MVSPNRRTTPEGRALGWVQACPNPTCQTEFLNRAHNQRRRYCSPRCCTHTRVARRRQLRSE
ncbi:CGNR zinc finger domain-containing protein [Kocuria sp. CH-021]|uniref:CGNR zinc finger domain-containing protein n=1 Tax=Kocuria sp. CH-021 TaxID=3406735 RepID=UPI003C759FDD